jgi:hypothetical protein
VSYPTEDLPAKGVQPIPVTVRNWQEPKAPGRATKTTAQIYVLNGGNSFGICTVEPTRRRLAIHPYDNPCGVVFGESPKMTPDPAVAGTQPNQGIVIDNNSAAPPWEFFGTDAVWLNSVVGGVTRVAVIKEYE